MQIDICDDLEAFDGLKANWDRVYCADPEAHFFLSHVWMKEWFREIKVGWFVLAAKPLSAREYVAFFPLRIRTKPGRTGGFFTEVAMAGNRFCDYTGFICTPGLQAEAIAAFARAIKTMNWARVHLECVRVAEQNLNRLLKGFPARHFEITRKSAYDAEADIDNGICPFVDLPADWASYLALLSANSRQKLKRLLRKVESSDDMAITHTDTGTLERDLDAMMELWRLKWEPKKKHRAPVIDQNIRAMLRRAHRTGNLFLPVLWSNNRPVGVLASLIDWQKRYLLFLVGARDTAFRTPQPGLVLHAHSIRYAIEAKLTRYDFLRGNEPYKYSFGASERKIASIIVESRSKTRRSHVLDRRSIPDAFKHVQKLHADGKFKDADLGYRQILSIDPGHKSALFGFGASRLIQNDPAAAEEAFRALLALSDTSQRGWTGLAKALAAQNRKNEAEAAVRRAETLAIEQDTRRLCRCQVSVKEANGAFSNALVPNLLRFTN